MKYLREFVLIEVPESEEEKELEFTDENALELMKNSSVLDSWIAEVMSDLGKFTNNNSKKKSTTSKSISKSQDLD